MTFGTVQVSPLQLAIAAIAFVLLAILAVLAIRSGGKKPRKSRREPEPLAVSLKDSGPVSPDALQGGLRHMPLPDLLQFLAQGRRTGTLEISSGRRAGTIRLVQGMVIHAEFRRTEDLDALYGLLSLDTGDFVFTPGSAPDYAVNGREVVDILMLWLSRKDSVR